MDLADVALIDLQKTDVRRGQHIVTGSLEDGAAIAAAEVLIDADDVPDTMLVGRLLDLRSNGNRRDGPRPTNMTKMLEVMTAEKQRWLATRLYEYHDECDTMLAATMNRSSTLTLVTDASVQSPHSGVMAAYITAQQRHGPEEAPPPPPFEQSADFVAANLRAMAEARARVAPRQWRLHMQAAGGPTLGSSRGHGPPAGGEFV